MIVDCAVYEKGRRRGGELSLEQAYEAGQAEGSFVWIGLREPTMQEFDAVAREFNLHELAVEDAVKAHQRPKLEVYDDDLFVVLKTARYDDLAEAVQFQELQVFIGDHYVVTVRHGAASSLSEVRATIEQDLARIRFGPMAVLHAVMDRVVDDYAPVIEGLDNDMAEIEDSVFDPRRPRGFDPSERIFKLKREVLGFIRNTETFLDPLSELVEGELPGAHPELATYFRDVQDHLTRVVVAIHHLRDLLSDALDANLAQVTTRQNDDMRTISAWVAIGGIPTVIGAVYGMNFEHMPELGTRHGYFVVLAVMALLCGLLYQRFKRIGWL
jgi:magnesium transporter